MSTASQPNITVSSNGTDVSTLEDPEFEYIVNQDVRGQLDSALSSQLRLPQNVYRWYNMLNSLKKNVEAQFIANRAELIEFRATRAADSTEVMLRKAEFERWKANASRFKTGVENKMAEAKLLKNTLSSQDMVGKLAQDLRSAKTEIEKYRTAIYNHQSADDVDAADDDLYSVL
jgi:hypothetical protein